jgi:hypothetical protein
MLTLDDRIGSVRVKFGALVELAKTSEKKIELIPSLTGYILVHSAEFRGSAGLPSLAPVSGQPLPCTDASLGDPAPSPAEPLELSQPMEMNQPLERSITIKCPEKNVLNSALPTVGDNIQNGSETVAKVTTCC